MKTIKKDIVENWIKYTAAALRDNPLHQEPEVRPSFASLMQGMMDSLSRKDAHRSYEKIEELRRLADSTSGDEKAELYLQCALASYRLGNARQALTLLQAAIGTLPGSSTRKAFAYLLDGLFRMPLSDEVNALVSLENGLQIIRNAREHSRYGSAAHDWLAGIEQQVSGLIEAYADQGELPVPPAGETQARNRRKYADVDQTKLTIKDRERSEVSLTPTYLLEELAPFLKGLEDLQTSIHRISRQPVAREVRIRSISQNSPAQITVEGLTQAISLFMETVVPWRSKHARAMAALSEQEKYWRIRADQAALNEQRSHLLTEGVERQKIQAETEKLRQEAESLRLQNEEKRLAIQQAEIELAMNVLTHLGVQARSEAAGQLASEIMPALTTLVSSSVEISEERSRLESTRA